MDINLRHLCLIVALLPAMLHGKEVTAIEGDYVIQPAYGGTIENTGKGVWIIDPRNPGPELPVVGRSLFDLVFPQMVPTRYLTLLGHYWNGLVRS